MDFKRISVFFFIVSYVAIGVFGGQDQTQTLTLEQCLTAALSNNPLILSSRHQYEASLARFQQARSFSQPSLDYDSDLQPKFFNFGGQRETYFGFSQTLEFPGKRVLRGTIARRESDEFLQDMALLKQDITFQVKEAFYGLLLAREQLNNAEMNRELSRDFRQKAELKFEAGDVAKVEVLRARVEAAKADNAVRSVSNEIRLAKARLNYLLARKKYAPLEIEGQLKRPAVALDLDKFVARALSFRPEIRRIGFSMDKEKLVKRQGFMSILPDFDLGVTKHWIGGEGSFWDVTVSLPIPLFFWQPKKGEIAEAEANLKSLQREGDHLRNAITLEVEEAYMNILTAENQITLFEEEILKQAEEVYDMFLFSYQEGEIGSIELIEARRTLMEARMSYTEALYNYDIGIGALERAIGHTVEGDTE